MRSALVFIGACLALTGAILCAVRGFGSTGAPYYSAGRCYLGYDELYFDRSEIATVTESIAAGNLSRLLTMPRAQVPAVTVCMYRSRDNGFVAMQAFEYVDLEYRPLTLGWRLSTGMRPEGAALHETVGPGIRRGRLRSKREPFRAACRSASRYLPRTDCLQVS